MKNLSGKRSIVLSRISTVVVLVALLSCIIEPIGLHQGNHNLDYAAQTEPFLIGSLVCAIGIFLIFCLTWLKFYNSIVWTTGAIITARLIVKVLTIGFN